jgi:hypothetical protein
MSVARGTPKTTTKYRRLDSNQYAGIFLRPVYFPWPVDIAAVVVKHDIQHCGRMASKFWN